MWDELWGFQVKVDPLDGGQGELYKKKLILHAVCAHLLLIPQTHSRTAEVRAGGIKEWSFSNLSCNFIISDAAPPQLHLVILSQKGNSSHLYGEFGRNLPFSSCAYPGRASLSLLPPWHSLSENPRREEIEATLVTLFSPHSFTWHPEQKGDRLFHTVSEWATSRILLSLDSPFLSGSLWAGLALQGGESTIHSNNAIWRVTQMPPAITLLLDCEVSRMPLFLVAQSCPTLCDPMDCSLPGSSVHWDSPSKNTGVGGHALLWEIFPTQGSNPGLPHCRRIFTIWATGEAHRMPLFNNKYDPKHGGSLWKAK